MKRWTCVSVATVCLVGGPWLVAASLGWSSREAEAVPVFARKYQTSCQTCHVVYPKLTPFGEAFRRNGYRFPAGEEMDARTDEPVMLGHDAHKRVWPGAVWPGELPETIPLGAQLAGEVSFAEQADTGINFETLAGTIALNFASTFGDHFAAWAGAAARGAADGTAELELERAFAVVTPLDGPYVHARLGRFEPSLLPVSMHRMLGLAPWLLSKAVDDNQFTIEPVQLGVEVTGVLASRVGYSVGLVEGAGNLQNTPKDVYGRVEYKLGGMALDGRGGATASDPWAEQSVSLGAFGYLGHARIGDPDLAFQDDRFAVVGADARATLGDFDVVAVGALRRHERPSLEDPTSGRSDWHLMGQIDYVAFPWLVPSFRYEHVVQPGTDADRLVPSIYVLVHANIRAQVLASVSREEGDGLSLDQLMTGLRMAF